MNAPTTTQRSSTSRAVARQTRHRRSLWGAQRSAVALFAPSAAAHRVRRTTDVVLAVASALVTWAGAVVALPPSGFERAVDGLVAALPSFLDILWRLGCGLLVLWTLWLVLATLWRRRFELLGEVVAALALTTCIGTLLARRMNGDWPSLAQIVNGGGNGLVPAVGLASAIAVCTTIAPQLTRPWRRLGWSLVAGATASMVLLGSTTPTGGVLALSLGVLGAALVHLLLGTQAGRVSEADVIASLSELGVEVRSVVAVAREAGLESFDGVVDGTGPVVVRVYGRDARDTQVLTTLWRAAVYRGAISPALTRLQQVEHEGFVTLLAQRHGVAVPEVLAAGCTVAGDALIVLGAPGGPLEPPPAEEPVATADDELAQLWALLEGVHAAGLAVVEVDARTFARTSTGELRFRDLRHALAAPSDDRRTSDLAQLLVLTAVLHGADQAVVAAQRALGADGLAHVLPYLQPAAAPRALRKQLSSIRGIDVDHLRALCAAAAGVESPPLARLRRVSPATLMRVGLLTLIAFALITTLGGISVSELRSELGGASWGWVVVAVVVGQLPFLTQAIAARGACPRPIAYGPLAVLQFAIGFINLAIPSSAARIALDVRFFQRQGVPATAAVSIAAIDGFSGFLVQIGLLVATLVFGVGEVDLTFSPPASAGDGVNVSWILVVGLALVVLAIVVATCVGKVRRRIVARVGPVLGQVRDTVRSLRSPVKLLQLFGGSLANQFLFALTLGACLHAFGGQLDLATLLVVYVGAALFGGMMPVPGGIGVMEAALIALMTAGGITTTVATATAILFRLVTFYLPPVWGWVAFNWLQRHEYL